MARFTRMSTVSFSHHAPTGSEPLIALIKVMPLREAQYQGRLDVLEVKDRMDLCPTVTHPIPLAGNKSTFELHESDKRSIFVKDGPRPMSVEELNGMLLRHRQDHQRSGLRFDAVWHEGH